MGRFTSEGEGGTFHQAPPGTHIARCFKIIDIGTQHGEYQGKPTAAPKIIIAWEIPGELVETQDGPKPVMASKFYTNSLNEKANLRHDLESWRGKAFTADELKRFDLTKLLGIPCLLTIIEGEKGKTKINSVAGLAKGMTCPAQCNQTETFFIDEWNEAQFNEMSDGLKKLIMASDEYKARSTHPVNAGGPEFDPDNKEFDDGIPF